MSEDTLINTLKVNKLMRSPQEIAAFENALTELAENPSNDYLPALHLVLDDACEYQEVMFSLVHFLESFEVREQLQAFVAVVPQLIVAAPEWTRIIHERILNDESICRSYKDILHSVNSINPNFFCQLLEDSAMNKLNFWDLRSELAARKA